MLDRPSSEVLSFVNRLPSRPFFRVEVTESPVRVAEDWAAATQVHYEHLQSFCQPNFACLLDDDVLPTDAGLLELRDCLRSDSVDIFVAETLMVWDEVGTYNTRFPVHHSDFLFRCLSEDRFPDDLVSHCPDGVRRAGRRRVLRSPLLHLGYLTPEGRQAAFARSRRLGKLDAHTLALTRAPCLRKVAEWRCPDPTP